MTEVDAAGRYQKEQFGNGTTTSRSYFDAQQTLKSITTWMGSTSIQDVAYKYNARLNLKSRTDHLQLVHKTERFRHDALERLTCALFLTIGLIL